MSRQVFMDEGYRRRHRVTIVQMAGWVCGSAALQAWPVASSGGACCKNRRGIDARLCAASIFPARQESAAGCAGRARKFIERASAILLSQDADTFDRAADPKTRKKLPKTGRPTSRRRRRRFRRDSKEISSRVCDAFSPPLLRARIRLPVGRPGSGRAIARPDGCQQP